MNSFVHIFQSRTRYQQAILYTRPLTRGDDKYILRWYSVSQVFLVARFFRNGRSFPERSNIKATYSVSLRLKPQGPPDRNWPIQTVHIRITITHMMEPPFITLPAKAWLTDISPLRRVITTMSAAVSCVSTMMTTSLCPHRLIQLSYVTLLVYRGGRGFN